VLLRIGFTQNNRGGGAHEIHPRRVLAERVSFEYGSPLGETDRSACVFRRSGHCQPGRFLCGKVPRRFVYCHQPIGGGAATVSDAIRAKETTGIAPIQDVGRYLFRVFLRKVAETRRSDAPFERASRVHSHLSNDSQVEELDSRLLLDRVLGQFDSVTREMILRRIEGHSWNEIASEFGLSNHAARVRFSKAVQRLRSQIESARNGVSESTPRKTQRYHRPRNSGAQRVVAFEIRLERMFTPAFYREFHQLLRSTRSTESF
jgi:hypothetical protein